MFASIGWFLIMLAIFKADKGKLNSVIDELLEETMQDGSFNCRSNRAKSAHSSLHTAPSILEGFSCVETFAN